MILTIIIFGVIIVFLLLLNIGGYMAITEKQYEMDHRLRSTQRSVKEIEDEICI